MSTLAARYYSVKTRVGGNREKHQFEWTFGTPRETLQHIAMPGPEINRILGQLEFALKLSGAEVDKFEPVIGKALEILELSLNSQGVLTRDVCIESEKCLLPIKDAAKEYLVLCASHAHIDMNWMWAGRKQWPLPWQHSVQFFL